MSTFVRHSSNVSRFFAALRQERELSPGQLAAHLGASNPSKVGSLIRLFELGEQLSDHWLQKLITELKPDPVQLQQCIQLDQAAAMAQLELERIAWEAWADEPIEPFTTIRYMPGVYGAREVNKGFCNNREEAELWASRELKQFRAKGFLNWTRREQTWYDQHGLNPRRRTVTFEGRTSGAWMQLSGSQQKFLLSSTGELITRSCGLDQPC